MTREASSELTCPGRRASGFNRRVFNLGNGVTRLSVKKIVLNITLRELFTIGLSFFCMLSRLYLHICIRAAILTFKLAGLLISLNQLKL